MNLHRTKGTVKLIIAAMTATFLAVGIGLPGFAAARMRIAVQSPGARDASPLAGVRSVTLGNPHAFSIGTVLINTPLVGGITLRHPATATPSPVSAEARRTAASVAPGVAATRVQTARPTSIRRAAIAPAPEGGGGAVINNAMGQLRNGMRRIEASRQPGAAGTPTGALRVSFDGAGLIGGGSPVPSGIVVKAAKAKPVDVSPVDVRLDAHGRAKSARYKGSQRTRWVIDGKVGAGAIAPDGKEMVVVENNNTLRLVTLESRSPQAIVMTRIGPLDHTNLNIPVVHTGAHVVTVVKNYSADRLRIWGRDGDDIIAVDVPLKKGFTKAKLSMVFHDGSVLVTLSHKNERRERYALLNPKTGKLRWAAQPDDRGFLNGVPSPKHRSVFFTESMGMSDGAHNTIVELNLHTGRTRKTELGVDPERRYYPQLIAVSPNGRYAAMLVHKDLYKASWQITDMETGKVLKTVDLKVNGQDRKSWEGLTARFSRDGSSLIIFRPSNGKRTTWDWRETGKLSDRTIPRHQPIAISAHGNVMSHMGSLGGDFDIEIRRYDK